MADGVLGIVISVKGGAASCATTFGFGCIAATVGVYTSSDHMITGLNNFGKKTSEQNPTITVQGLKQLGLSEPAANYIQFALDTFTVGKAGMSVPVKSAKPGYVANVGNGVPIVIEPKIAQQMAGRGWTEVEINLTINNPAKTVVTKDTRFDPVTGSRLSDPATGYIAKDGSYVVRNDRTGQIVQISNKNDPSWKLPW